MKAFILLVATLALLFLVSCPAVATPQTFAAWAAVGEKIMTSVGAMRLQSEHTLDVETGAVKNIRDGVAKMQAHIDELSPEDKAAAKAYAARAEAWAKREESVLAAETEGRTDVVVPLCNAYLNLEDARKGLAHERANPSGVVNLVTLHDLGKMLQCAQEDIKYLTPRYVAFRRHAYTSWKDEGACFQE